MSRFRTLASLVLVLLTLSFTAACSTSPAVAEEEALPPEDNDSFDFEDRPGTEGVPTEDSNLDADVENEKLREGIEGDEVD